MKPFKFLLIFALLNVAFAGSHATLTKEELHWKSVFPNTPVPKVLLDILPRPGQRIIFRVPESEGVNDPEFGAYWYDGSYGDNISGKDSKTEESLTNKGVNDPEFGAYGYDDSYGNKHSGKVSKDDNAPTNRGAISGSFGDFGYQYTKDSRGHDHAAPNNKGVNDPEFGAYAYDDSYGNKHSGKESKNDNAPTNRGAISGSFGDFGYQYTKDSRGHDHAAPNNKGVNDPDRFFDSNYNYEYSAKESKDDDAPNNKEGDNAPSNRGAISGSFGDFGYQYTKDDSWGHNHAAPNKGNEYSSARPSNYDDVATIKETIYFFQDTLRPGKKLNLPRLTPKSDGALFLPQQIAESMPMSSDKLLEILKNFSLKAESSYADNVRVTVMSCQRAEMRGEEKYCAASLESFVDLGVSILGKNIILLSHRIGKGLKNPLFTVGKGVIVRDMGDSNIVCHKMKYPYAVYLCHSIKKTIVYEVPLVSMDGTRAHALAVCHRDTSAWSPNHIAFRFLKVKPGSVPICHFLGRDTIVWVPN